MLPDLGFRLQDLGFRLQNLGFRVQDLGFGLYVSAARFWVSDLGFRVRVQDIGCGVQNPCVTHIPQLQEV